MEGNEENKEEKKTVVITEGDLKYAKKQWLYKTIAAVVIIATIIGIASASVTYYVTIGKNYSSFYDITSKVKSDKNKKETVASGETIDDISEVLTTFADVIDKEYIGEIDKNTLIDETVKGFVKGIGDEYSEYMTASEWEDYQADGLGNFVGVGVYMTLDSDDNVVIVSTIKDTPAEKAGLQPEDIIIGVDDESVVGMNTDEVSKKVKGVEGTEVTLNINRKGERLDFKMKREAIKVYHAESKMLENNVGYISLLTFDEGCAEEFKAEMDKLVEQGAKKVIIDLRYNTGGLVDESLAIADLFLDKDKTILITKSADGTEQVNKARTDKNYDMDIVILVNKYTASASEILTGALEDNKEAVTVGELTYGKGVIQNVYQLLDGSVLKLTTQEYFTPNRTKINKVGIKPDYEVKISDEDAEKEKDSQLEKAQELLK